MKTITFFIRKLCKQHKKETILDVTITFFLKQVQTRASSGPITLPLKEYLERRFFFLIYEIEDTISIKVKMDLKFKENPFRLQMILTLMK